MAITLSQLANWSIEASPGETLAHAAEELRAHLSAPEADKPPGTVRIVVRERGEDGFDAAVGPNDITITGDSPRGALNGVYWLLEQLGILWVKPGGDGIRRVPGRELPEGSYNEQPAFARRTLILGNDGLHDEWRDWMEFASRNRMNDIFFHDTPPSRLDRPAGSARPESADEIAADGRGWLFELWDREGAEIIREASKRGISLQFGGHHLPGLLPRDLFSSHPDWFPLRNGERNPRYNLCTSSPGAVDHIRHAARAFFQRFPGADVYHLWADDIRGGGWCDCPDCADFSASDQALRATNLLAEILEAAIPGARIAHLAYHDTIDPPKGEPRPNVVGLYAPRPRNYAFALDDEACPRNAVEHWQPFLGLLETFSDPSRIFVFEYYSDAVLFKWLAPPHLRVLPGDARAYASAGVGAFGNLAVTPRPWFGPNWHAWWHARCSWAPETAVDSALRDFCAASFEEDAPAFVAMFNELEAGYRLLLDLGDLEPILRHDVLDFSDTPRQALANKAEQMRKALGHFENAVRSVPLAPAGLGMAQREELALQFAYASHLASRVIAWDHGHSGRRSEAAAALVDARNFLHAAEDWHATHVPPAFANLSRNMFRAANWHTEFVKGPENVGHLRP